MSMTTTTRPPSAPSKAPVSISVPALAPPQLGCSHLPGWLSAEPDASLERLKLAVRWDVGLGGAAMAKTVPPPPPCSTCLTTPLRPILCLACGTSYCGGLSQGSHGAQHAQKEGHQLAWDLRSKTVYCYSCGDYVRHPAVERLAVAEEVWKAEKSQDQAEGRAVKRKRTSMQAWELSPAEHSVGFGLGVPARGIRNLGNSCYLSVILQTFFSNPYLRSYYLADRHNRALCAKSRAGESCLSCEVDGLFSEQYAADAAPLAPTRFLHSFWQNSLEAAGYAQQDAHEFLISSLNLIHSASPQHTDNPALRCPCIVHSTFSGQLRSAVICGRCGHQSETLEPFLDLSLDIRDRASGRMAESIGDALGSFTSPEQLPSKFDCAACGPGVPSASKRLSLKTLPNVLCIQFKRFEHTSQASKIDAPVQYPLKLDMAPFLSQNIDYPAAAKSNPANASSKYNLIAVVAHDGTLSQGHYTAYVRGADDYFAIDDDKVRRVRIAEVLAAKAYLVVYSRV
ncbi:hypothetical protein JCM10213_006498 [Rhodosporidiobolus nylandii]